MRNVTRLVTLAAALSLALVGCKKSDPAEGGNASTNSSAKTSKATAPSAMPAFFDFIPADSPYVFASAKAMPDEAMDKIFKALQPLFDKLDAEMAKEISNPDADKMGKILIEEFKGKLNKKGLESLGIHTNPKMALYGLGLLPALRMELKDPKALLATIARIEAKRGKPLPSKKLGELKYWSKEKDGVEIDIAVVGNELIVGVLPVAAAAELLPVLLGQKKLEQSAAANMKKLMTDGGFAGYGMGYVDFTTIAATIMGTAQGYNAKVWTAAPFSKGAPQLEEVCKQEIGGMVANMPRMTFGYTEATAEMWAMQYTLEMKPELAKALTKLITPVPGVGEESKAIFSFGLGLNVAELMSFAKVTVEAMKAKPYACPLLNDLNGAVGMAAMQLGQLKQLPPFVKNIHGFHFGLKDVKIDPKKGPTSVNACAFIRLDKPDEALQMLKGMAPPLAKLKVAMDGKPVAVPAELLKGLPMPVQAFIAMNDKGIALMIGEGEDKNAAKILGKKAPAEPALLSVGYDMVKVAALTKPLMGMVGGEEAMVMDAVMGLFKSVSYATYFTPKGVVFKQKIYFN
ncbi:hypothetical protein KKB55_08550 [Myxococcota bacterium]|nr:hypothetical protein [Myxococcota bacterium]MBU1897790.1 hypothetical protein [Myxococcota bacterium]